jgi:hypothetical protein
MHPSLLCTSRHRNLTVLALESGVERGQYDFSSTKRGKAKTSRQSLSANVPNNALQLTAYSLRSCVAPAFGSS